MAEQFFIICCWLLTVVCAHVNMRCVSGYWKLDINNFITWNRPDAIEKKLKEYFFPPSDILLLLFFKWVGCTERS